MEPRTVPLMSFVPDFVTAFTMAPDVRPNSAVMAPVLDVHVGDVELVRVDAEVPESGVRDVDAVDEVLVLLPGASGDGDGTGCVWFAAAPGMRLMSPE